MNGANARDTILLVEDDPNDVALLRRAFRKLELLTPVHLARDGEEAIDYLEGTDGSLSATPTPSLILLDLKLPRRSGLEVLEWRRTRPRVARVPCIVFTSSRQPSDVRRAYDLGANSYLVKPSSYEQLTDIVRNLRAYWLDLNVPADPLAT